MGRRCRLRPRHRRAGRTDLPCQLADFPSTTWSLQLGNQRVATITYSHPRAAVPSSTFGPRSNDAPLLAFGNEGRGMVRDARGASECKPIWNSPMVLAAVITSYHGFCSIDQARHHVHTGGPRWLRRYRPKAGAAVLRATTPKPTFCCNQR